MEMQRILARVLATRAPLQATAARLLHVAQTKRTERIQRGLTERMYLLRANRAPTTNAWQLAVQGTKGDVYTVGVEDHQVSCTCMYAKTNYKVCKHVFFVFVRIAKMDPALFVSDVPVFDVAGRFPGFADSLLAATKRPEAPQPTTATATAETEGVDSRGNTECCICYEGFGGEPRYTCERCANGVHAGCLERWLRAGSTSSTCPLCRHPIDPSSTARPPGTGLEKLFDAATDT